MKNNSTYKILKLATLNLLVLLTASLSYADFHKILAEQGNSLAVIDYQKATQEFSVVVLPAMFYAEQLGTREFNQDLLENRYFKIVEAGRDEALPLTDLEGRNVFFHLNRARDFFAKLDPINTALNNKIKVSVRETRVFNVVTKYGTRKSFNNSRHIPADVQGRWDQEIWFHKGNSVSLVRSLVESGYQFRGKPKALDSAFIPTVIYHEAFHWASNSDGLRPASLIGDSIGEDYANYFAASIAGLPVVGFAEDFRGDNRDFSKIRRVRESRIADCEKSGRCYNDTRFLPSVFWQMRKVFGNSLADKVIWNSIYELNGASDYTMIPSAILESARKLSLNSESQLFLTDLFNKYSKDLELMNQLSGGGTHP